MKKLLLSVLILFSVNIVFAQFDKKIKSSDEDIQNEKKKTNPKTWLSRATLYQDIYDEPTKGLWAGMTQTDINLILRDQKSTGNEIVNVGGTDLTVLIYADKKLYFLPDGSLLCWEITQKVVNDPLQIAHDAYTQTISYEKDGGTANKKLKEGLMRLANQYKTEASNNYYLENYDVAFKNFKKSIDCSSNPLVGLVDSAAILYAGVTAQLNKDSKSAEEYLDKAVSIGYTNNGEAFLRLAMVYSDEGKKEQQLKTLENALNKFPENTQILLSLIDYYRFAGDDPKKVLPLIDKAKEADPKNPALYYAEGSLYEKIAETTMNAKEYDKALVDYTKAIESYTKATEVDPTYFFGHYGLGAVHFNLAANYNNAAVETPVSKVDEYERLLKLAEEQFELSLQPMLEAYKLSPNEKSIIQSLKDIYFRFRTKSDEYNKEYEKFNSMLLEMN